MINYEAIIQKGYEYFFLLYFLLFSVRKSSTVYSTVNPKNKVK